MLGVIKIKDKVADLHKFRIFGEALLENEIDWPLDYKGNHMLFFVGIPAFLINDELNTDLYCNFFITYTAQDDEYLYDLQAEEEIESLPTSCMVVSRLNYSKPYSINSIPEAKSLVVDENFLDEIPYWLQNPIDRPDTMFQFEIYGGEIDAYFDKDFGDECYYFFTDLLCSKGHVFVQMT